MARGAKADEFRKMQTTVDEKDWQIWLLKEMIRGVKGELKVWDVDMSRLKDRNKRLEFNDSIMTDKW